MRRGLAVWRLPLSPAGQGLVSTMCDMTKFCADALGGGSYEGRRILGPRTVRFMRTGQLTKEQSVTTNWESCWGYGYGNLMRTMEDPAQAGSNCSVGEFGWDGWMGNYFFMVRRMTWYSFILFRQRTAPSYRETAGRCVRLYTELWNNIRCSNF